MGDYKKYAKPVMIKKDVYDDLKSYKDKNNFPSFTEAIRELLEWRRKLAYEDATQRLQEALEDPGSAASLDCTYIPGYEKIGVFPPEIKKLIEQENR